MRILVTNDDGWQSDGIRALREAAEAFGDTIVVAPETNYSGASSSLTLQGDIRVHQRDKSLFTVHGTPTDCVHLVMTGKILSAPPDIIVSGINNGSNMGDDTIYSGTVAAAMEGNLFGIPAFAFSMASCDAVLRYDTGVLVVQQLLERFRQKPPSSAFLLNINIPNVELADLRGMQQTRLGRRHAAEPAILKSRDNDHAVFEIGEAGAARDGGFGTDFYAIEQGYASVTPLTTDLTAHTKMGELAQWL